MKTVLLTDICDIQYGYPFDSSKFNDSQGMPLIRIRDVMRGFSETYTTEECDESYIITEGELLVGMDGEFNISRWGKEPALLNQRVCHLIPKKVDKGYLFYFMPSALKKIEMKTPFVTVKHLSAKELNKVVVPLPEMEEQCRISATIDKVSLLISKRREELAKLDGLVKARFVEMFSGEYKEVTAENVCAEIVDCPHSTPKYDEDRLVYPAIRTSEIQNGGISWESMKYVGIIEYEKRIKRLKPLAGDIVYAREGTYGDCVILPDKYEFCLGQRTMLFRPNYEICTSAYLHAALRSEAVRRQADKSNAGSTVPHVNVADAKRFHFPLPSLALQQQFADFVSRVDKSKAAVERSLSSLETLKKSLMQQYFG